MIVYFYFNENYVALQIDKDRFVTLFDNNIISNYTPIKHYSIITNEPKHL